MRLNGFLAEMYVEEGRLGDLRLDEVVLHEPAEMVLAPYVNRAPSEVTKRWILTNFKNWVLKQPANLFQLPYVPINATPQQKKAFEFKDLYDLRMTPDTITQLEHILDYFTAVPNPPRLERMSVENVYRAAEERDRMVNAQAAKEHGGKAEASGNYQVMMEFPNGFKMVEMLTVKALGREGYLMGHCVGDKDKNYVKNLANHTGRFFSLRDANNMPHCTIETDASDPPHALQIKGKSNLAPAMKYWQMLREFIAKYNIVVRGDPHNVGLLYFNGRYITQDQFKDIILDPDNEEGQKAIMNWNPALERFGHKDDFLIAMFNATYGTERMTNGIVQAVFRRLPQHAISTIEHYGNRLNLEQIGHAFVGLGLIGRMLDNIRQKIIDRFTKALKPDADQSLEILKSIERALNTADSRSGMSGIDDEFVAALFRNFPDVYADMLFAGGDAFLEKELSERGPRAAGPFFAFVSRGKEPTSKMIYSTFQYFPGAALKLIKSKGLQLDPRQQASAFDGIAHSEYRATTTDKMDEVKKLYMDAIQLFNPGPNVLTLAFKNMRGSRERGSNETSRKYLGAFLSAIQELVPDHLDEKAKIEAVVAMDDPHMYEDYFSRNPNPPLPMQHVVYERAEKNGGEWENAFRMIQYVHPSLIKRMIKRLRPEEVDKTEMRNFKGVERTVRHGSTNYKTDQIQKPVPKEPSKIAGEYNAARHEAAREFMKMFSTMMETPASKEPGPDRVWPKLISPDSPKYQWVQQQFADAGRPNLFRTAMERAHREWKISTVSGTGNGWSNDRDKVWAEHRQNFAKYTRELPAKDLARLIATRGYGNILFVDLINSAPERVGEVMASAPKARWGGGTDKLYSDFKWKGETLDKDKVFIALESVWAEDRIPDGIKDDFTVLVFGRFKPRPGQILGMLERADIPAATEYVLKKSKKPEKALVQFAYEQDPESVEHVKIEYIPDEVLKDAIDKNPGIFTYLAKRELRGWRVPDEDRRRRYVEKKYHDKINRESDLFKRFEKIAKEAGKGKAFERFARMSELEDMHDQLLTTTYKPWTASDGEVHQIVDTQNLNLPMFKEHIKEWSDDSLMLVSKHDPRLDARAYAFKILPDERLIRLIRGGFFNPKTEKNKFPVAKFDTAKMNRLLIAAANTEDHNRDHTGDLYRTLKKSGFEFTDDAIMAYFAKRLSSNLYHDDDRYLFERGLADASDTLKDRIAKEQPELMKYIDIPNKTMVKELFDKYGKIKWVKNFEDSGTKNARGGTHYHYVNRWMIDKTFDEIVRHWFKEEKVSYMNSFRDNPEAAKLLMAEGKRRGPLDHYMIKHVLTSIVREKKEREAGKFAFGREDRIIPAEDMEKLGVSVPAKAGDDY